MIRDATATDAPAIAAIYNHYIIHTTVTFEEQSLLPEELARRLLDVQGHAFPWLVYEDHGTVVGYCYANLWKSRSAYRRTLETTVYLSDSARGRGIGTLLYTQLIELLRNTETHALIGGIALPNPGSVALHEKLGFKKVAHLREVGWKFSRWIDVGYWELVL